MWPHVVINGAMCSEVMVGFCPSNCLLAWEGTRNSFG